MRYKIKILIILNLIFVNNFFAEQTVAIYKNIENIEKNLEREQQKKQQELSKELGYKYNLNKEAIDFIEKIKNIRTFSADFEQKQYDTNQKNKLLNTIKGKVYIIRANKFLWQIDYPEKEKQVYVTNGSKFWHYDVGLEQAVVDNFDQSRLANSPMFFLVKNLDNIEDIKDFSDKYEIKNLDNNENIFTLKIKDTNKLNNNYITNLEITFENNKKIQQIDFIAAQNKKITVIFNNTRVNSKINNSLFNFRPPRNVDVINAEELA